MCVCERARERDKQLLFLSLEQFPVRTSILRPGCHCCCCCCCCCGGIKPNFTTQQLREDKWWRRDVHTSSSIPILPLVVPSLIVDSTSFSYTQSSSSSLPFFLLLLLIKGVHLVQGAEKSKSSSPCAIIVIHLKKKEAPTNCLLWPTN